VLTVADSSTNRDSDACTVRNPDGVAISRANGVTDVRTKFNADSDTHDCAVCRSNCFAISSPVRDALFGTYPGAVCITVGVAD